jgi:phage-related baseplate assembly protein
MTLPVLPAPQFALTDPTVILADLVSQYEALTGRTLYPGQIERMFISLLTYLTILNRNALQQACLQQLVLFATGAALDHRGVEVDTPRLGATPALTTLRITLPAALSSDIVIPAGYQVQTKDAKAIFITTQALLIPRGALQGDVAAQCQMPGTAGNGYQPGDVCQPMDLLPTVAGVLNTTPTTGGADPEEDDHYRARILDAPSRFSVAGPAGAYRSLAFATHPDILDVAVEEARPGVVAVYVLLAMGLPSPDLLALIQAALSGETVRPLCDEVVVLAPIQVPFSIQADLTLFTTADPVVVLAAAQAAAVAYRTDRQSGLGRDLVGSQLIKSLSVDGVYKVELAGWADQVLGPSQWAACQAIQLNLVGLADG